MTMTELSLAPDAVEVWVQDLDAQHATQALLALGLWSPRAGNAPTDHVDAAYELARRTLNIDKGAITFRLDGCTLHCQCTYGDRVVSATAHQHQEALALTRAVLRAVYEARLL